MKHIGIRVEVLPFIVGTTLFCSLLAVIVSPWASALSGCVIIGYFLYFFRDPDRISPCATDAIVAGADGAVAAVTDVYEGQYLKTDCVRISIFLSLFDVHVNRAPISGKSTFLGYFRGKHLFTFQEKSSDVNQHNKILIEGARTRCLVTQIVGPVCRRVVYWHSHDEPTPLKAGDRIGMMKFGSRLDMYFPAKEVEVVVRKGDIVRAGVTIVARLKKTFECAYGQRGSRL
jgi:phosphatidylserine decarboxylase